MRQVEVIQIHAKWTNCNTGRCKVLHHSPHLTKYGYKISMRSDHVMNLYEYIHIIETNMQYFISCHMVIYIQYLPLSTCKAHTTVHMHLTAQLSHQVVERANRPCSNHLIAEMNCRVTKMSTITLAQIFVWH